MQLSLPSSLAYRSRGPWLLSWSITTMLCALLPLLLRAQVPARRADDFVNSVGIGTHWDYPDTPYGYAFDKVLGKLKESGIRHARGGEGPAAAALTAAGIGSGFSAEVPANQDADYSLVLQLMANLKKSLAAGNKIDFIEGPNEPDLFWGNRTYKGEGRNQDGGKSNLRGTVLFMQDMYAALKADPATKNIPVVGPSMTRTRNTDFAPNELENFVDYGNFHPYCGGNSHSYPAPYAGLDNYWWYSTHPSANLTDPSELDQHQNQTAVSDWLFLTAQRPFGAKLMAATETGYTTWPGGTSEAVHAKYMPRLFLEYFRLGVVRTYSYELVDEFADPNNTESEAHYGLLHHDLTPKPAFTAVQSLLHLLADPAGRDFTPAALAYTVQVTPPAGYGRTQYVKHQLFQKQNGKFYLVIYHEISNEDSSKDPAGNLLATDEERNKTPNLVLTHPAMPTTITLPASIGQATAYAYDGNFAFQASPVAIANNKITVQVQDQVMVIELSAAPVSVVLDGTYRLLARHSGKALDVDNGGAVDGTRVQQWAAITNNPNQQWALARQSDGAYTLTHQGTHECLDVSGNSGNDGAKVQQWLDNGTNAQRWVITPTDSGYYKLVHQGTSKCLDVAGGPGATADGVNVIQYEYRGGLNQQWKLERLDQVTTSTVARTVASSALLSAEASSLTAYPNPSAGRATLALSARTAQRVLVYVYDQQGTLVSHFTVPAQAGRTDFALPGSLPPGTYHLRAVVDGQPQQFPLQVK